MMSNAAGFPLSHPSVFLFFLVVFLKLNSLINDYDYYSIEARVAGRLN